MLRNSDLYDDKEVMAALNNAVVALARWQRLEPYLRANPNRMRSFADGILATVREAVTIVVGENGPSLTLTDAEIALSLQLATLLAVFSEDVLPENAPVRRLFAGRLFSSLNATAEDGK